MTNSMCIYNSWKSELSEDEILESDLNKMHNKDVIIEESFSKRMEFGTAGIRGVLGAGTNKINVRTIGAAAEAYAQYLIKHVPGAKKQGIVIGHDNRHNWKLFSHQTAKVCAYYGIKVYLFNNNDLQPTPLISYAIRKLKAVGGVVITASHNPAQYNGFKVYNEFGAQLTSKFTKIVSNNMNKIDFLKVNTGKFNPFYINQNLIDHYVKDLLDLRLRPNDESYIKIVYSPLHGTGHKLGPLLLHKMNYECRTVTSQMTNDPTFAATKSPNPEDAAAYSKGIALAKRSKSDIVLLTDPDADRIGVVVKYKRRYKYLTGNQVAALYLNYKLTYMELNGGIPKNSYIVKSNVSSDLVTKIANRFNVNVHETHVGFKNIAELIEKKKSENFLFAFEESFGFLINSDMSRDKDAIQGLVAISEAANYYKSQKSDLYSELLKLYKSFDFYRSITLSEHMSLGQTQRFFERILRLKTLGDKRIVKIDDYRNGLYGLEKTNFIKIYLENSGWFAIRPSGTEPKVKLYYNLHNKTLKNTVILEQAIKDDVECLTEEDTKVIISKKTIFKFSCFVAILISIMVVLLFTVYNVKGGHGSLSIFVKIWYLMHNTSSDKKIWILLLIASPFIQLIPSALFIKRAMKSLGAKLSIWHAFIAGLIAISISAITPFATGGAIASYWYLRKKGYERKTLLSAFLMNSLIFQFTMVMRVFIFIPLGFWIFKDIYLGGSTTSYMILALTLIGFLFDCFSTIMIALLTMNKKIQNTLITLAISFLEWLPFVTLSDPLSKLAKYEHEFYLLRSGMKGMFKNKKLLLELFAYESINIFYSGYLFAALSVGASGALSGGVYLEFLTGTNLIRSANSMIPTPGGTGTTEWMSKEIFRQLFRRKGQNIDTSAAFTGLVRLWTYIFPLMVSSFVITVIYFNEKLNWKIRITNKNDALLGKQEKARKNKFKHYFLGITSPIVIGAIAVFLYFLFT